MRKQSHKIGARPLQVICQQGDDKVYSMTDYLFDSPHGFVWIRQTHSIEDGEYLVWLELILSGRKYQAFETTHKQRTPTGLRLLARKFADETAHQVR